VTVVASVALVVFAFLFGFALASSLAEREMLSLERKLDALEAIYQRRRVGR